MLLKDVITHIALKYDLLFLKDDIKLEERLTNTYLFSGSVVLSSEILIVSFEHMFKLFFNIY